MALPLCQYGRGELGVRLWPYLCQYGRGELGVRLWSYLSASMGMVSWELDCGPTSLSVWEW